MLPGVIPADSSRETAYSIFPLSLTLYPHPEAKFFGVFSTAQAYPFDFNISQALLARVIDAIVIR